MDELIRRVRKIHDECAPEIEKKQENLGDIFSNQKKIVSDMLRNCRKQLKQRDKCLETGENQKAAEISQAARNQMKAIKVEIEKLAEIQRQEAKKARKMPPEIQKAVASRAEIVELCSKHLQECENIEKGRFNESKDRTSLMAKENHQNQNQNQSKSSKSKGKEPEKIEMKEPEPAPQSSSPFDDDAYETDLQDIDNVTDELLLLEERNKDIDNDLDEIAQGVKKLKEIAVAMNDELKLQNQMIDQIETKVEKAGTHLESVNAKLKQTLNKVMKGDKFIVNFVLLCVLLAVIAFIASMFT